MTAPTAPSYVRELARYIPGKSIEDVARDLNLDPKTIVKLASNENPRGPSPGVLAAIATAAAEASRYPDGNGFALKAALSNALGVDAAQIVLGNGSNDILELATQAYLRAGDEAIYAQHAFAVYPLATRARGARGVEVPARNFGHDLARMRAAITPRTRMVFVANPNNPTGTFVPAADLLAFIVSIPPEVLVVLDEAYNEYLEPADRFDSVGCLARFPNLLVSRTFSKAHGLAALRVGYGIMDAGVADMLNRVRQPFNVNALAQAAAIAALADLNFVDSSRALNRAGMAQLEAGFAALGVASLPSHGNFILAKVGNADEVNQRLLAQGVIVRPVANYGLPEWLRISIGLRDENERFLAALASALGR